MSKLIKKAVWVVVDAYRVPGGWDDDKDRKIWQVWDTEGALFMSTDFYASLTVSGKQSLVRRKEESGAVTCCAGRSPPGRPAPRWPTFAWEQIPCEVLPLIHFGGGGGSAGPSLAYMNNSVSAVTPPARLWWQPSRSHAVPPSVTPSLHTTPSRHSSVTPYEVSTIAV